MLVVGRGKTVAQYELSDVEKRRVAEFRDDHDTPFFRWGRCNSYSLIFNHEGGIGLGVKIRCTCGAERDITDFDTW
jgi:hypothetical protein